MSNIELATAYISLVPSLKGAQSAIGKELGGTGAIGDAGGKALGGGIVSGLKGALGPVAALTAGVFGTAAIIGWGKAQYDALARIETINAQTASAIKSTGGAAGVTADHVENLAGRLEDMTATEAESIQQGANLLLTFKNIRNEAGAGNDIFDQTVFAMTDMARAMGTDAQGGAIQLGKALNDPIKGISALSRVGITFTEDQKSLITSLTESGQVMEAQKIILTELNSQFGGSAAAYAETTAGRVELLGHAWGTFGEQVVSVAMPAIGLVASALTGLLNNVLTPAVARFQEWSSSVVSAFRGTGGGLEASLMEMSGALQGWIASGGLTDFILSFFEARAEMMSAFTSAVPGIVTALTTAIPAIVAAFASSMPALIQTGVSLVNVLVLGLLQSVPVLVNAVLTVLPVLISTLLGMVPGILGAAQQLFLGMVNALIVVVPQLIATIVTLLPGVIGSIVGMLPTIIAAALQLFLGLVDGLVAAIPVLLTTIITALPTILNALIGMLPALITAALTLFLGLVQGLLTAIPVLLIAIIQALPSIIVTILGMLPQLITAALQLFFGLVLGLLEMLPTLLATLVGDVLPALLTALVGMVPALITTAVTVFFALVDGLEDTVPALIGAVIGLIPQIIGALMKAIPQLIDAGWRLVEGLIKGIVDNAPRVVAAIAKNITDVLPDFVKDAFGIASPSKVFRQLFRWVPAGAALGIEDGADDVLAAAEALVPIPTMPAAAASLSSRFAYDPASGAAAGQGDVWQVEGYFGDPAALMQRVNEERRIKAMRTGIGRVSTG